MALNRKPPAGSSQPWSHSFQRLFVPGVIRAASHRLVHNGDLSNAQSEHFFFSPFFFLLWIITDCLKCHLLPSRRSALCSSCPRVIAGHRPLCTICHLITDRFKSWGGCSKVMSAESLWTLMSNGTDLWKPAWGGVHFLRHVPLLGNWKWVNYFVQLTQMC